MLRLCSIIVITVGSIINVYGQTKSKEKIGTGLPKTKQMLLSSSRKIEVLSINKETKDTIREDDERCKSWVLTRKQIGLIIKEFEPMTSEEQYLSYSFYHCRIAGEIKIDGKKYKYWLGAGGTLTLKNSDTTWDYGCSGKKCKEYFLSGELTQKELEQ